MFLQEQKPAEQGRQLDRDKCSAATGGTHARDSGAAPRKQLLCYQSHLQHRHGMEWVGFVGTILCTAQECVSHYQMLMTRKIRWDISACKMWARWFVSQVHACISSEPKLMSHTDHMGHTGVFSRALWALVCVCVCVCVSQLLTTDQPANKTTIHNAQSRMCTFRPLVDRVWTKLMCLSVKNT